MQRKTMSDLLVKLSLLAKHYGDKGDAESDHRWADDDAGAYYYGQARAYRQACRLLAARVDASTRKAARTELKRRSRGAK